METQQPQMHCTHVKSGSTERTTRDDQAGLIWGMRACHRTGNLELILWVKNEYDILIDAKKGFDAFNFFF